MSTVCLSSLLLVLASWLAFASTPPEPYGPTPTPRQLKWHELETYGFIHFTVNTFTDKEWGYGDESPDVFNPTLFNADQIVKTAKAAGLKGLVLTCKHHDGFCLWPSKYTEHSVKNSKWMNGKGDVVREISDACHRCGLKFGVYLSPWDRNNAQYATPAYIDYYRNQLRELLTQYGPIFEVWFDGANGGDGYYGGARETRHIDNTTYYDWQNTWKIVRELQPDACMFSDAGLDVRWVGNESGVAGVPCWSCINAEGFFPGHCDVNVLNHGGRPGSQWLPAEVDVSIRPGWFYHPAEDTKVKSVGQLLKIYYESVGRGTNLILNIPPDRSGRIHGTDVKVLTEWRRILNATYKENLAHGATAEGPERAADAKYSPHSAVDGNRDTYWSTDDGVVNPAITLKLKGAKTFNIISIAEFIPLGERVDNFAVDAWLDGAWKEIAHGTGIGVHKLVRVNRITTDGIRLRITSAPVCPAISEIGLFNEPADAPHWE